MVKFQGKLSGACKTYVLKREKKFALIGGIATSIIFVIPVIVAIFVIHWIFVLGIPVLILTALLAGITPNEKSYGLIMPSTVLIDCETIISKSDKFYLERSVSEVVKVLDMGEWYHIFFDDREGKFVCQKSLLIEGSLDEFESIFKDKIIKTV